MDDKIKEEFTAYATALVLKSGWPIATHDDWTYGWQSYNDGHGTLGDVRLSGVGPHDWLTTERYVLKEYHYSAFQDTFSDNIQASALALTNCVCSCGGTPELTIAVSGTFGELINKLLPSVEREYR